MNKIPKKLHLYWDKSKMSKLQVFTVETFHNLNPDWEILIYVPDKAYTGTDRYVPDYVSKDYFYLIENMDFIKIIPININDYVVTTEIHDILRSDIFRYHILYKHGGMWSDFDVIWIKPMSHLNNVKFIGKIPIEDMGAHVTFRDTTTGHHNIGILLSKPEHPLYKNIVDIATDIQTNPLSYPNFYNKETKKYYHQSFGVSMWSSLYPDLETIINKHNDVVGLYYETFAPYPINNIELLYVTKDLSVLNDNVIGIHWFNGHVLAKNYVNNDKFGDNSSMTEILKNLGYEK